MEREKESKLKKKILKILPKAVAAVSVRFQNPPLSPGRDKNKLKGLFSGPMHMIPDEARRKAKGGGLVETEQEPTSPKISCMGQIKHNKKKKKNTQINIIEGNKNRSSKFENMLGKPKRPAPRKQSKSDAAGPPLGHMRRFASGRETFSNFDWKSQIAPDERDCYSDYDDRLESDAEDDVIIPFSAPLTLDGPGAQPTQRMQPRKEINLWKRRTMAPPRPLQLNPVLTAK